MSIRPGAPTALHILNPWSCSSPLQSRGTAAFACALLAHCPHLPCQRETKARANRRRQRSCLRCRLANFPFLLLQTPGAVPYPLRNQRRVHCTAHHQSTPPSTRPSFRSRRPARSDLASARSTQFPGALMPTSLPTLYPSIRTYNMQQPPATHVSTHALHLLTCSEGTCADCRRTKRRPPSR